MLPRENDVFTFTFTYQHLNTFFYQLSIKFMFTFLLLSIYLQLFNYLFTIIFWEMNLPFAQLLNIFFHDPNDLLSILSQLN